MIRDVPDLCARLVELRVFGRDRPAPSKARLPA